VDVAIGIFEPRVLVGASFARSGYVFDSAANAMPELPILMTNTSAQTITESEVIPMLVAARPSFPAKYDALVVEWRTDFESELPSDTAASELAEHLVERMEARDNASFADVFRACGIVFDWSMDRRLDLRGDDVRSRRSLQFLSNLAKLVADRSFPSLFRAVMRPAISGRETCMLEE
jgi:hypothetical protein